MLRNQLLEGLAADEFHYQQIASVHREYVVDTDDVGVIEGGCGPRLLQETAPAIRIGHMNGWQNFDGHEPVQSIMARFVYFAHGSCADLLQDGVGSECPPDHFCASVAVALPICGWRRFVRRRCRRGIP